jgi:CxxC motif-containing protein (DUF1111 family)
MRHAHLLWLGAALALAACGDDPQPAPRPPAPLAEGALAEGPLGSPRADITAAQREVFAKGEAVATRRFSPEEGLGPRFNVTFCGACHEKPTLGGGAPRYRDFYLFGTRLEDGTYIPAPLGSVSHTYGVGDAPPRPGRPEGVNVVARRSPIPFFGTGAIAEIYESSILAKVDEDDADEDGISGRANYDQGFVGRFGRKSQTVSIEGFIRGPVNNHMGITSDPLTNEQKEALPVPSGLTEAELRARQDGLRTQGQAQAAAPSSPLTDNDGIPDPELASDDLFALVSWSMLLGAPRPDAPTPETEAGAALFVEIGCAGCHVESLEGSKGRVPLYSDLLVHDMGEELGDGIQMGLASGTEFRTQPLWGVAATGPWLHDGRADSLEEAIEWHGGEGARSRERWRGLSGQAQGQVLAFLRSLGGGDQVSEGLLPPDAPIPAEGEPGGPLAGLSEGERALWAQGRRLFDRDILQMDGLGPLFNGDSCRACHFDPVMGGSGPLDVSATRHGIWNEDGSFEAPEDGTLIHKLSSPEVARAEPPGAHNAFELRQTPSLLGMGLIELIPEAAILANADPDDADGDGVRGVAHYLPDGRLGRFGWKGGVPSAHEFVRDALSNEVGLTLPAEEGMTFGFLSDGDAVADPEVDVDGIEALTAFLAFTAPLAPVEGDARGEAVFAEIGCDACHTPSFDTTRGPAKLYSDLLLHDLSEAGQRGFPDTMASETQFRTPPLWGLGRTAPYLHHGYASTVEAAIAGHRGEGDASRLAFEALPAGDREALVRFLKGL